MFNSRAAAATVLCIAAMFGQACGRVAVSESVSENEVETVGTPFAATDPEARGLVLNTGDAAPGYVLFSPLLSTTTYLVDVDGRVVHTWESDFAPGAGLYLLDNGNLLRSARDPEITSFRAGGVGGLIEEYDWDGELVWKWGIGNEERVLHHDIEPLPNGNVLALGWEVKDRDEALRAGRRPDLVPEQGLWPDFIVEIEKLPPDEGSVVWEWHVWDHIVQDHDQRAANYGSPAGNPHRLDINAGQAKVVDDEELAQLKALGYVPDDAEKKDLESDFLHINAVTYNPRLDQIALSVPSLGEIWILDHSTSAADAGASVGGRSGRGGDLLYRWGNPAAYGWGAEADKRLFYQHDVRWIPDSWEGGGNLTIFNNGGGRPDGDWSSVIEIAPPIRPDGSYLREPDSAFGPVDPVWTYQAEEPTSWFAPFISGAHRLKNGHTVICSGPDGRFFEIGHNGTIVWEYRNPFSGGARLSDGTMPQPGLDERPFATFRVTKIPADHPALIGRDLRPLDPQPEFWELPEEETTPEDGD
jgi:hypothetical protein